MPLEKVKNLHFRHFAVILPQFVKMSRNSLGNIKSILNRLNENERRILESYLLGFPSQYGRYESKYMRLYRYLMDNPGDTDIETIRSEISPDSSIGSFQRLIARLKDKILDSLLLDFNLHRDGNHSKAAQLLFRVRKQLSQAQILYTRGLVEEAVDILREGYKESFDALFYAEAVSFLHYLFIIETRVGNLKRVKELEREILKVEDIRNISERAQLYYTSVAFREHYQGNPETYVEELQQKIVELEQSPVLKAASLAYWYYLYMRVFYHRATKNYALMEFYAHEALHLLMQNRRIQNKPRIINGYLLLADASIYNCQFDSAVDYLDKSIAEVVVGSKNYIDILEHKSWVYIYASKWDLAKSIIQQIGVQSSKSSQKQTPLSGKLAYFNCVIQFLQRRYADAYKLIRQTGSFSSDKEGWNVALRILQIMIMIENNYLDEADQEIENFRRSLTNIMKAHPVSKRNILIFRMLAWLSKKDFDFARVYKEHNKLWQLLASDDPELRWDFLTPEIIPFHTWMENRALKRKADDNFYTPKTAEPALPQPSGQVLNN